jgi:hypothetical protein
MSIALMMLSLYFLYEGILPGMQKSKRKIYVASFWAGLSVVSCYVMFTFYIAILVFYLIYSSLIKNDKRALSEIVQIFWNEKIFWMVHLLFSLIIMYVILKLNPSSLYEFWPYNSFWGDTIYSLVETSFKSSNQCTWWMFVLFVLLITFSFGSSILNLYRKKSFSVHSLFALLFIIIAILLACQYYLFHITYVSYRGAIFLYPLIILMIFALFQEVKFSTFFQYASKGLLYLFSLGMMVNFFYAFSFSHGIGIVSKTGFVQALQDVKALRQEGKEISLGVSRAFPATIYYYKLKYQLNWLKNIGFGYEPESNEYLFYGKEKIKTGKYDYFIIEEPDIAIVSSSQKIIILKKYPESGIVLAKPSTD